MCIRDRLEHGLGRRCLVHHKQVDQILIHTHQPLRCIGDNRRHADDKGHNHDGEYPRSRPINNERRNSNDRYCLQPVSYTHLDVYKRQGTGTVASDDFSQFMQGFVTPGSSTTGFYVTSFLQGNANRYYRANQLGTYVQDKWQVTPTLSLTAGVRCV